ncbi:MAG: HAD hydrolase family protein [Thermoplasmata archaeon]
MSPADLRVVVTDVDGTLTDRARHLDPLAIAQVRTLESAGTPVLLATGNALPIALALQRSLGLSGPIIAENGGVLYDPVRAPSRIVRLADPRPARAAYRRLRASGLPVRRLLTDRWRECEVALEPSVSAAAVRRILRDWPVRVEYSGYAIHLMAPGSGKLPALETALAGRGWTVDEAVVLGDGDNDVAMLRDAGLG